MQLLHITQQNYRCKVSTTNKDKYWGDHISKQHAKAQITVSNWYM